MANEDDRITAVRAYLTKQLPGLGDVTYRASKDESVHYFRVGNLYTMALSEELWVVPAASIVDILHANLIASKVRSEAKGVVLLVDSYGRSHRYTPGEWEQFRKEG